MCDNSDLLDYSQQKIVQLFLLVHAVVQLCVVQCNATPHQVAAGDLFVLFVEGFTSPQLDNSRQLAISLYDGLIQCMVHFTL